MPISDEEKRQIMEELARGNPDLPIQEPSQIPSNQSLDAKDYQNFDDFAQRSPQNAQAVSEQIRLAIPGQIKERITTDLNKAKEVGQLRSERVREIVQSAVFQMVSEFKSGSSDIRLIVKDAVSAAIENLQEKGGEVKEEITASIEGAIEGATNWRHQAIAKTQTEVKQLQSQITTEEDKLQQEIESLLADIENAGKDKPSNIKASIESAITTVKNSDEMALMQKRYAQLQAQLAILKANLAARYGGRHEEIKEHLDDAKTWYNQTRPQAEAVAERTTQQREQLEEKLGDAGTAIAKKELKLRQVLRDLLLLAADNLREKHPPTK